MKRVRVTLINPLYQNAIMSHVLGYGKSSIASILGIASVGSRLPLEVKIFSASIASGANVLSIGL